MNITSFLQNTKISTYLKYFISYLIIFTVLVLGFFFILKVQITAKYFTAKSEQVELQLNSLANYLSDDINFLTQIDSNLTSNKTILDLCYHTEQSYFYPARTELMQYISTANLLHSIVYMPKNSQNILSTLLYVEYRDDKFSITDTNGASIEFDPTPYYNTADAQLIFIENPQVEFLIYFPPNYSQASYVYFYIIDTKTLQLQLQSLISSDSPAIALVDSSGKVITGVHTEALIPYMNDFPLSKGLYQQDANTSTCVSSEISNGISIVSLLSNEMLTAHVNTAFATSYLTLLFLSLGGFVLIFLIMKFTYGPLHQLVKTIIPDYDTKQSYVHQLSQAFSEASEQNRHMQKKLNNYRLSIQKSLLDALLIPQYGNISTLPNIDQFFDGNLQDREIFILKTNLVQKSAIYDEVVGQLRTFLPENGGFVLLETTEDTSTLLVNFTGTAPNKSSTLTDFCRGLYQGYGCLFAISNSTASPLDIPSLYENVNRASTYWPQIPIACYADLPSVQTTYNYPHDTLDLLSERLKANDFTTAKDLISGLLTKLRSYSTPENTLPSFFVNCILIDMLTIIANNMSLAYIDFHSYSDMYFNILYLCRSFSFTEKEEEIMYHTNELLDFYEKTITDKLLNTAPIKQLMEENYCDPDFSIAVLAEHYHISVSRMSVLFKNELNIGFADYLWLLRLEKAKKLLKKPDMSIDEISIAVGYLNTSSFRRKFKKETGLSPSQFRAMHMDFTDYTYSVNTDTRL